MENNIPFLLNLDRDFHRKFKIACSIKGISMSEVIRELMREWVDEIENSTNYEFYLLLNK